MIIADAGQRALAAHMVLAEPRQRARPSRFPGAALRVALVLAALMSVVYLLHIIGRMAL